MSSRRAFFNSTCYIISTLVCLIILICNFCFIVFVLALCCSFSFFTCIHCVCVCVCVWEDAWNSDEGIEPKTLNISYGQIIINRAYMYSVNLLLERFRLSVSSEDCRQWKMKTLSWNIYILYRKYEQRKEGTPKTKLNKTIPFTGTKENKLWNLTSYCSYARPDQPSPVRWLGPKQA